MIFPRRSAPRYDCLLMIQPCISHWKVRMIVQHSKMIQPLKMPGRTCDRIQKPVKRDYILHGQALESVTSSRYLGVDISGSLSWNPHVNRITGNGNRTLGFVRRNIKTKMSKVCKTAYNTLVRPQLEYASAVWDPHTKVRTSQIEQVQR